MNISQRHSASKWVIGNWKMNPVAADAQALAHAVCAQLPVLAGAAQVNIAIVPTLLHLQAVATTIGLSSIKLAAQDVSLFNGLGAYTGEVSATLLHDAGVALVLVGHSERRTLMHETETFVTQKIRHTLDAGLIAVLCVGETLAERDAGEALVVVLAQVRAQLMQLSVAEMQSQIIIAYEPVWAIGTGRTASPEDAQQMHAAIRACLVAHAAELAQVSILYGGSVKADNAHLLAACPDIDGALVGGASLDAASFATIVRAFAI